jgi:hypothetical protein
MRAWSFAIVALMLTACSGGPELSKASGEIQAAFVVTNLDKNKASAGEAVRIEGSGLNGDVSILLDGAPIATRSEGSALVFDLPAGPGGMRQVTVTNGEDQEVTLSLLRVSDDAGLPVVLSGGAEALCAGQRYRDYDGSLKTGQKVCATASDKDDDSDGEAAAKPIPKCTADGQADCVVDGINHRAAALLGLEKKVLQTETVAGTTGTVVLPDPIHVRSVVSYGVGGSQPGSIPNCTDLTASCYVPPYDASVQSIRPVDVDIISAGDIRNGATVAGRTGAYPSASFPLPDASTDVDLDNFITRLTTTGDFEFWDSNGVRNTGSGDPDIIAANIVKDVVFDNFGITGTAAIPSAWDVRTKKTSGAAAGKLKVNCRNGANLSILDIGRPLGINVNSVTDVITASNHGLVENQVVRVSATTMPAPAAAGTDYFVAVIDANTFRLGSVMPAASSLLNFTSNGVNTMLTPGANGTADAWDTLDNVTTNVSPWGADHECGGIATTADDDGVWLDLTPDGCNAATDQCVVMDKITGLSWSENVASGGPWGTAWSTCSTPFAGHTDWRLPTLKEYVEAFAHGMRAVSIANWLASGDVAIPKWTATTDGTLVTSARAFLPATGGISSLPKQNSVQFMCVRGGS